jgi:hypothetical protein
LERTVAADQGGRTGSRRREAEELDSRFSRCIVINRDDSAKTEWSSSDENTNMSKRASTCRNLTDAERSIIAHDQIVLDQLRGSRLSLHSCGVTARVMTVQMWPDTSPERYSTRSSRNSYKRRSLAMSRSSVDLRLPLQGLSSVGAASPPPTSPRSSSDTFGHLQDCRASSYHSAKDYIRQLEA